MRRTALPLIVASTGHRAAMILTIAPLAMLGACSTGGQHLTRSGFLSDYSQMGPTKNHKKDAIFVASDYEPGVYTKVIIDPVEWHARGRKEKTRAKLKADFHQRLTRKLGAKYQIVDASQAGPGVLRVRSAITGTRPARWYLNVPAQTAQLALGGFGMFRPSSGGASQEMQVQDAVSGRSLVQVATFRNGKPWNVAGSYVPYDHARGAFTQASELLTEITSTPRTGQMGTMASLKPDAYTTATIVMPVAGADQVAGEMAPTPVATEAVTPASVDIATASR